MIQWQSCFRNHQGAGDYFHCPIFVSMSLVTLTVGYRYYTNTGVVLYQSWCGIIPILVWYYTNTGVVLYQYCCGIIPILVWY